MVVVEVVEGGKRSCSLCVAVPRQHSVEVINQILSWKHKAISSSHRISLHQNSVIIMFIQLRARIHEYTIHL